MRDQVRVWELGFYKSYSTLSGDGCHQAEAQNFTKQCSPFPNDTNTYTLPKHKALIKQQEKDSMT